MERYKNQQSYRAEAQYYLEITNYDLKKALDEFEADMQFQREAEKKVKEAISKQSQKKKKK